MKVTISANEPLILREAQADALFLLHVPGSEEGVFALLTGTNATTPDRDNHRTVVCVGCRVGAGDRNHFATGRALMVHADSPITLLEQVETAALRARPTSATAFSPAMSAALNSAVAARKPAPSESPSRL